MDVVVVESPAKARTIRKLLGSGYRVLATSGHVSDLPARAGSVDPEDGFAMVYETGRRAARALAAIRAALADAGRLVLATDPDREGEAIAWQVLTWLRERDAIGETPVARVVFHEITPGAVRDAMAHPREIDLDLVRAQQARRALDYLVGFGLSPVLWRKVPGCRSAGRVQSVALRLVCEREAAIEAFAPVEYWTVEAQATAGGGTFRTGPSRLDGAPLDRLGFATRRAAADAARRIREADFTVAAVERTTQRRRPGAPFTTATLQQEAARRLGFRVKRTMEIAQMLYEGVDPGGERAGLITYMRTDSTALSKAALGAARRIVGRELGERYLTRKPRVFRSRARNAQEAHEAIRPTELARSPESLAGRLDRDAARLYGLIRDRTLASQMAPARFERVEVALASAAGDVVLEAAGSRRAFDGFLRVYRAGNGDAGNGDAGEGDARSLDDDRALPALEPGRTVRIGAVRVARHVTAPPARYTEAGLVRRLEELGIGRPSTWAAIVGVLQDRQYMALAGDRFVPLERGRVAAAFLEAFFARWVDYSYTAGLETDLDRIAAGALARKALLGGFWGGFHAALETVGALGRPAVVAAIERTLADFIYGPGEDRARRRCPSCASGELRLRSSRHGLFVGCLDWPACGYRRPMAARDGDGGVWVGPKPLGEDPGSGLAVTLRRGPYGHYVEAGNGLEGTRPARMSVPGGMVAEAIDLDAALALLALPREVGIHPETGAPVLAGIGRYGPWLRHGHLYAAIPDDDDVLSVGLNRAIHLIEEKEVRESRSRGAKRVLRELGSHPADKAPVWLKTGHYGPFVAHRRRYASLPEDVAAAALTLERALELLEDGQSGRPGRRHLGR